MAFRWQLEENTDLWQLEENTDLWLLEENAAVPDIVGETQAAASSALTTDGFTTGTVTTANSDSVSVGLVISQNPAAASVEGLGTAVDFVVSLGPAVSSASSGGTSKRSRKLRQFVELPNGKVVEVMNDAEAKIVREAFKPDPEEAEVPERRILRMTPEVKAMIDRYKKQNKAKTDGGLIGKRKGLTS